MILFKRKKILQLNKTMLDALEAGQLYSAHSIKQEIETLGTRGLFLRKARKAFNELNERLDALLQSFFSLKIRVFKDSLSKQDMLLCQAMLSDLQMVSVVLPHGDEFIRESQRLIGEYDCLSERIEKVESLIRDLKQAKTLDMSYSLIKDIDSIIIKTPAIIIRWDSYETIKKQCLSSIEQIRADYHNLIVNYQTDITNFQLSSGKEKDASCVLMHKENAFLQDGNDYSTYKELHLKLTELVRIKEELPSLKAFLNSESTDLKDRIEARKKIEKIRKDFGGIITDWSEYDSAIDNLKSAIQQEEQLAAARFNQAIAKGDLQKAQTILKDGLISSGKKTEFSIILDEKEQEYSQHGIAEAVDIINTVSYVGTFYKKDPLSWDYYPGIFYPPKGSIIFPYRRRKIGRRGYLEPQFESYLAKYLPGMEVLGDAAIHLADDYRPYEPDIAIIDNTTGRNIRIDIEIDEPYSGYDRKPIHYIGCGDESRDFNLCNAGWVVIRFAEVDIALEMEECFHRILKLIQCIAPDYAPNCTLPSFNGQFHKRRRWTRNEAVIMSVNKTREKYLGIDSFGRIDDEIIYKSDIRQTEKERMIAQKLARPVTISSSVSNLDNSTRTFDNDSRLTFIPEDHSYYYDGYIELKPVSEVVSSWFNEFDAVGNATRKAAYYDNMTAEDFLRQWDKAGAESREVGTFMHRQIENIFKGRPVTTDYVFRYGNDEPETISIKNELDFFNDFLKYEKINPFRTEWPICDIDNRIAGTIDCLCKNGAGYDIYDWKRTRKLIDEAGVLIDSDKWGKHGKGKLSHLDDCNFWHYALQQNLYRYILEKAYNIKVNHMYLVVLRCNYYDYHKIEVPKMTNEIQTILANL